MALRERVYSILIVSATDSFTSAFKDLLSETRYSPVHTVSSVSAAKRLLAVRSFDLVIINAPLPDDDGTRFAIDISTAKQTAVLLLIKGDIHADVQNKVVEYGVFTLPKPIAKPTLMHALNWMESARERLRQFEKKSQSIDDKMAEIRIVNKAKWVLISHLNMNEPDAHRYIEKQAMNRCISKKVLAEEIIRTYT